MSTCIHLSSYLHIYWSFVYPVLQIYSGSDCVQWCNVYVDSHVHMHMYVSQCVVHENNLSCSII